MTRSLKRMPTPLGVGAGQTASCNLPLGLTYERFYIRMNVDDNGTPTDVAQADWGTYLDQIRLMVDGDAKIEIEAGALVSLNAFYGENGSDGVLPLFLSRPWMRTMNGEDQTAYGTAGGMASFSLEMDIKAGVTINSLDVYAVQTPGRPFGPHLRIQRFVRNQGVTGEGEISDITRGPYALMALHVQTANIADVEIIADQRSIHKSDKELRAAHYEIIDRAPQAGFTHVDFLTENRVSEALPMTLQDFRLRLDFTATGNFAIFSESIQGAR